MTDIQLVDVSIRDGNQSLWGATGLSTPQVLQIAPVLNRVGFRALDFTSSTAMGVSVRTFRENPWERIRLVHAAMPDTRLQLIGTGFRFISWEAMHPDMLQLVYNRLVVNGVTRFVVLDPMHDMDAVRRTARMIRSAGGEEIVGALTFTISAVHDDAFYADLADQMAACPDIDRVYVKDPAGLVTTERAATLFPALLARLGDTPLELHSHCTIGNSPRTYLAAARLGVQALQVACGPLANGTSLPDAHRVVANLRELGYTVDIDDHALDLVAAYFHRLARANGLPVGRPQEYDAAFEHHQVPGGVITTLKRHLAEVGLAEKFDAVMAETGQVRAELGYPIMVTPFPQLVCTQALYNVIGDGRYATVPDEVIRYALGTFGRPTAPIEPEVLDRIMSRPRARELAAEPPPPGPAELRKRFRPGIDDEELLLRAAMPAEQVDAMLAAGPVRRGYNPELGPLLELLRELRDRPDVTDLVVQRPGLRVELRRG
ncbi:MAG: hypothetical protein J2P15_00975 [Micromonosporaceae bacterium]|nr:hypothetical protein [Micromonosporaceae bacterium]